MSSKRKRPARQTHLTFNQLPSSSPAKSGYSSAVHDRLAGVGFDGSPKSNRATQALDSDDEDEVPQISAALPTPVKSSQGPSHTLHKSSLKGKGKSKSKQGTLDFGQHTGFHLVSDDEQSPKLASRQKQKKKKRGQGKSYSFGGMTSTFVNDTSDSSSDDTSDDGELLPKQSSSIKASGGSTKRKRASDSRNNEESETADEEQPPKLSPSKSKKRRLRSNDSKNEDSDEESEPAPTRRSRRSEANKPTIVVSSDEEDNANKDADFESEDDGFANGNAGGDAEVGEAETSGDEVMFSSPPKKSRGQGKQNAHLAQTHRGAYASKTQTDGFVVEDDEVVAVESSEEDAPSRQKSKRQVRQSREHKVRRNGYDYDLEEDDFLVADGVDEEEGDEEDVRPSQHKRSRKKASESDSDAIQSPTKRRRLTQHKSRQRDRQEQDDLAEDLDFLGTSKESPSRLRSSAPAKKDARREALEQFKRFRAGQAGDSEITTQEPPRTPRRGRALYDTDSESASHSGESSSDDEVNEEAPDAGQMFGEDEYDEGFIDDEGAGPVGAPALPLEFSALARAKPKDLFKHAVEFMVQKKLNPGFDRTNEVYELTFRKLDDEVHGLAGSKFISSAWKAEFSRSLRNRPYINAIHTGASGFTDCEACGRTNHPATFQVQFKGKPYDPKTLEEPADHGESESDSSSNSGSQDDDDAEDHDKLGNVIPPPSKVYHVGQHCMKNAQTAHTFEHWRFHLNEWVVEWLQKQGYLKPEEIVKRDGWKLKKRTRYANKVADKMEEVGEVKGLYRAFKAEIEAAYEAKGSGWRDQ